ncbi:PR-1-like protein [Eremomyces bilateralis CBS 781.70]|uniref:PR-1-like protein n=1 Tax=Eremomyces bilateralis CBS 781.70 TaxID=1392243 RepID=A0A6G1GD05_9PEZI|nr:PR-1-like protein [Eremomyces bilateralis CBS 781.70]KAF1815975.1 PR-1-like protein [Eremomyces bilateralis CBS 781.70]
MATNTLFNSFLSVWVLFSVVSSQGIPSSSTAASPVPQPTSSTSPTFTDDTRFRETCLNSTNTYRQQHSAASLTWNDTLAEIAADATTCAWKKLDKRNFVHLSIGKNLALGFHDVTEAVDSWGSQRRFLNFSNTESIGFSHRTIDFTQLVWKNSTQFGCGRSNCNPAEIVSRFGNPEDRNFMNTGAFTQSRTPAQGPWKGSGKLTANKPTGQGLENVLQGEPVWVMACVFSPRGNVIGQFDANVGNQVSNSQFSGQGIVGNTENGAVARLGRSTLVLAMATFCLSIASLF